ncbi:MAG: hypothetical protein LBN22_00240, partial [Clostridiales Family XIII bacterium]|nr:hypothetical protein [Clostridiales Family XIII bacterium]
MSAIKQNAAKGSTLVYAMVAFLIITILLATCFFIVQNTFNRRVRSHTEDQAYYTALSVTKSVAGWLTSEKSSTKTQVQT